MSASVGEQVIVVGGANSAGKAGVFLSRTVAHVHLLVRSDGLAAKMSSYLIERIEQSPSITLHPRTEITAVHGDTLLRCVTWTDRTNGESQTRYIGNVFVMIGAQPNTNWLAGCIELDAQGFRADGSRRRRQRPASPFETMRPGGLRRRRRAFRFGKTLRVERGRGVGRGLVDPRIARSNRVVMRQSSSGAGVGLQAFRHSATMRRICNAKGRHENR